MATAPGDWTWTSGASVADAWLTGKTGGFTAIAWTEAEKSANPNRRGIIKPTSNGHAFVYDDGTPFFFTADTLRVSSIISRRATAPIISSTALSIWTM